MEQLDELSRWMSLNFKVPADKKVKHKNRSGYRILFDGPPTNLKLQSAEMIGREFNKEVYRIDLSTVVSKYIGETEKNLATLLKKAEDTDAILFIDEADALFGKRTEVKDVHDKYAKQEISYLLKRIEEYPGIVILAGNMKGNIDDTFIRRFQTVVQFPASE